MGWWLQAAEVVYLLWSGSLLAAQCFLLPEFLVERVGGRKKCVLYPSNVHAIFVVGGRSVSVRGERVWSVVGERAWVVSIGSGVGCCVWEGEGGLLSFDQNFSRTDVWFSFDTC